MPFYTILISRLATNLLVSRLEVHTFADFRPQDPDEEEKKKERGDATRSHPGLQVALRIGSAAVSMFGFTKSFH